MHVRSFSNQAPVCNTCCPRRIDCRCCYFDGCCCCYCVVASLPCPLGTVTRLPLDVFFVWHVNGEKIYIRQLNSTHSALNMIKICKHLRANQGLPSIANRVITSKDRSNRGRVNQGPPIIARLDRYHFFYTD